MTRRFNGGVRGKLPTISTSSASGMWDLLSAHAERGATNWPTLAPPALYAFTTATFTPGGQNGQDGPALSTARSGLTGTGTDAWKNNTQFFNTTNGIQLWTVPATGNYRIEAFGAQGGGGGYSGGTGARMRGDFSLTYGETIRILVGQTGAGSFGGGGGGSYNTGTLVSNSGLRDADGYLILTKL